MAIRWLARPVAFRASLRLNNVGNFPKSFVTLPLDQPIEEETLPHYNTDQFYPVHIGDVYNNQYRITGKLGYGAHSTSWLCQDLQSQQHAVLKMSTLLRGSPTATDRELGVYAHLTKVKSDHPGQSLIRELYDSFEAQSHLGNHQCLVLQPMHMTILEMMKLNPRPFGLDLLKLTLRRILLALDFLHTDARVIHTDLKTDNLMLSVEDTSMLSQFANEETNYPSPRKQISKHRTIYQSRKFCPPPNGSYGLPILCDFGEARIGKSQETGPFVQPSIYRAPEIIFEMPWGSPVDIWNLGALIWDLFEGYHLFGDIFNTNGGHDEFKHLALVVALLGPPPPEFVKRSETTSQCFDHTGAWIAQEQANVPHVSLESMEERLLGTDQQEFLQFVRRMLQWMPEERRTAKQLLEDPWLL